MFGRKPRKSDEPLPSLSVPDLDAEVTAHWNRGVQPPDAPPAETSTSASLDFGPASYGTKRTKESRRTRRRLLLSLVVGLVVGPVAVAGVYYLIRYINPWIRAAESLGERVTFGPNELEEIYYSRDVAQEQAEQLGRFLQNEGIFNGLTRKSVRLSKKGEVFVVGFALEWNGWQDPELVGEFRALVPRLSRAVFAGRPVEIHLCAERPDSEGQQLPTMRIVRAEDNP